MTTDNERLHELVAIAAETPAAPVQEIVRRSILAFRVGARVFGAETRHVFDPIGGDRWELVSQMMPLSSTPTPSFSASSRTTSNTRGIDVTA